MRNQPPQGCRTRLQAGDFDFIVKTLGSREAEDRGLRSLLMDAEALNQILDQKEILSEILQLHYPLAITPELYFYVLVRHSFKDAGIEDREVADYVAATLAQHAYGDATQSMAGDADTNFSYHVDFLNAIGTASTYDQFYLHVRCANQFLVLTGLFPRFIRRRRDHRGAPGVRYYESVARNSFESASHHPLAEEFALSEVYETLAEVFPKTRRALNHLAEEYLFLDQ